MPRGAGEPADLRPGDRSEEANDLDAGAGTVELPPGTQRLDASTVRLPGTEVARLLQEAGYLAIEVANEEGDAGTSLRLAIEVFGSTITISVPSADLTLHDLEELAKQPTRMRSRYATYRRLEDRSVAELERLGLPLYWNEEWLRAKYEECGSFAEIARRYRREVQGVTFTAIANYARDAYDWSVRGDLAKRRDALLLEYENRAGTIAQVELAAKFEVNASSVNRWIAGAHQAHQVFLTQRATLAKSAPKRAAFADDHGVPVELLDTWLKRPSPVFSVRRAKQPKKHYYTSEQYEALRERAREIYRDSRGRATKTKVARDLGIDRSTVAGWFKDFEKES
jgi:hypothetical protein